MNNIDKAKELNNKRNEIIAMRLAAIDKGTNFKKFNNDWRKAEKEYFDFVNSLSEVDQNEIVKSGDKELVTFRKVL